MVSIGAPEPLKENAAFVSDTTAFGGWSLDIYLPSSLTSDEDHQIMMSKEKLGIETLFPIFGLNILRDNLELASFNGTIGKLFSEFSDVSNMKYDIYQRYDLIRTTDRFYVFIDNEVAFNQSFDLDLDTSVNYFGIVASQGSNVRFDNIQITTDATGLLNEILNPPSSTSPLESTSVTEVTDTSSVVGDQDNTESSSNDDTLFLTIGSGGVTLAGGAFSWRKIKKKESLT